MTSRKQRNNLAHRVSKQIIRQALDFAYVTVKTNGLVLQVSRIDGKKHKNDSDSNPSRINVAVEKGVVTKSWVG